jgi:hypothetical protein
MGRSSFRMDATEFAIQQIKTDGDVSPQIYEYLVKLAKEWGVAVTNIAWLQMKPYPMQGALYQMLKNKCEKEGLVVKSMVVNALKRAESSDKRAGFEADITLFDQRTFDEIMKKATLDKLSVEMLRETRDMLTHKYHEEGWASLETVRAPAMQNPDYLNHMSATRAVDRALRMIVRCPFTAASELPQGEPGELLAGVPGIDSPPEGDGPLLIRPGQKPPEAAKPVEGATATPAKPGEEVAKPEKTIPQKPIKKIEEKKAGPKDEKVNDKQASLVSLQWEGYCKEAAKGITKKDIDEKLPRLLKALYGKDSPKDLTVGQLEEMIGLMARKEIEVSYEGAPPPAEKPEVKT